MSKRSAQIPVPEAKRAATEKALLAAQQFRDDLVQEQAIQAHADAVVERLQRLKADEVIASTVQQPAAVGARTIILVIGTPDEHLIYQIVELPGWFPDDFNRVWTCKVDFYPGHKNSAEWLSLVRILYSLPQGDAKHNPLFGVTDMAERKRILSDDEECKKFFAAAKSKLEYFDVCCLGKDGYNEPTVGPARVILISFD